VLLMLSSNVPMNSSMNSVTITITNCRSNVIFFLP
jgi:hypothetical protein